MTVLITILSTGKDTWTNVAKLITNHNWEKIFIITNEFGKSTFNKKDNMDFIVIDPDSNLENIEEHIYSALKNKNLGFEVAINFISGFYFSNVMQ